MINKILEYTGKIFLSAIFILGSIATAIGFCALLYWVMVGMFK